MTHSPAVASQPTLHALLSSFDHPTKPVLASKPTPPPPQTFIPPRSFNTIQLSGSLVIKTSSASSIRGELYFYQHIPSDISHLFPRLHWHQRHNRQLSFAIDRVYGTTLSAHLVNGTLSNHLLFKLLQSLTALHRSNGAATDAQTPDASVYACYSNKVVKRFTAHKNLYHKCGLSASHFDTLCPLLRAYESERRGCASHVIHGDPVLTNALLSCDDQIKLIDMRGAQGSKLTLTGDAVYDLGKVLQSLCGYDHILANAAVDKDVSPGLIRAQRLVREYVECLYAVRWIDVVLVTCSLFTSLIPLHDDGAQQRRFASVADALLECVREGTVAEGELVRAVVSALGGAVCET